MRVGGIPRFVLNFAAYMATKKTNSNKSTFIRSQPAALSTADVIAKAKAHGLKISSSLVYMVRGRKKSAGSASPAASRTAKKSRVAAKSVVVSHAHVSPASAPPAAGVGSKAAFVRSRTHLSPREIVEDAKAAGLTLDVGYVYNVRGAAKARSTTPASKVTKRAARTARTPSLAVRPTGSSSKVEDLLKAIAAELGLGRAMEILAGERARVRAVIEG
jgi:hypothetical protein